MNAMNMMRNFENIFNSAEMRSSRILEEAYEATTKEEKIELAQSALEVYPDNIDAELYIASFEEDKFKKLSTLESIIEKAKTILENGNYFSEQYIGHFWGILETRPYMRAKHQKLLLFLDLERYSDALEESEELLKLCESDNLGIRYTLLGLYCYFERYEECEKLFNNYDESSTRLLLPMAIMYYKQDNFEKSKEVLQEINENNPHLKQQLKRKDKTCLFEEAENLKYYSFGGKDEAILVVRELNYLLESVPEFLDFVEQSLTLNG
ncbi:hypothetical protein PIROE2DRAFT_3679 [Piromyces sp. E2]|nr:hypothetical protein PIROE2DRAFT_3679 [Piromyces sp. E2]|eukprot:OUM68544.1 hypothetical protein PIROE2DRAFT_3679 [Piromyces sp. E2]